MCTKHTLYNIRHHEYLQHIAILVVMTDSKICGQRKSLELCRQSLRGDVQSSEMPTEMHMPSMLQRCQRERRRRRSLIHPPETMLPNSRLALRHNDIKERALEIFSSDREAVICIRDTFSESG
jgi:hypothetical protein